MSSNDTTSCIHCGGKLELVSNNQYRCLSCLSTVFLKNNTDEEDFLLKSALVNRLYHFEFEKAINDYQAVLRINAQNTEALFGLILATNGIEYVKDFDNQYKPTFHRLSKNSVLEDLNYLALLKCSSGVEKEDYIKRVKEIERIRIDTLNLVEKEKDYDIFICYKKNTGVDNNVPSEESTWGLDLYVELSKLGYKVFFAEKEIKEMYEPVIYKALNSAKFMIILCSSLEHLKSKWLVNEYNRFLSLRKSNNKLGYRVVYEKIEPAFLPFGLREIQAIDHNLASWYQTLLDAISMTFTKFGMTDRESIKHRVINKQTEEQVSSIINNINRIELGSYTSKQSNIEFAYRIKEIEGYFKVMKYQMVVKIISDELLPIAIENYQVYYYLMLSLISCSTEDLFNKKSQLLDLDILNKYIKYAPSEVAEEFLEKLINYITSYKDPALYQYYFETVTNYETKSLKSFLSSASELATHSSNSEFREVVSNALATNIELIGFYEMVLYFNINTKDLPEYNKLKALDSNNFVADFYTFRFKYDTDNAFSLEALSLFEKIIVYAKMYHKDQLIRWYIKKNLSYIHTDFEISSKAIDFYLSYMSENSALYITTLNEILDFLSINKMYQLAIKYANILISCNEKKIEPHLRLLLVTNHVSKIEDLATTSSELIRNNSEYQIIFNLATELNDKTTLEKLKNINIAQFENLEKGVIMQTPKTLLDRATVLRYLNAFKEVQTKAIDIFNKANERKQFDFEIKELSSHFTTNYQKLSLSLDYSTYLAVLREIEYEEERLNLKLSELNSELILNQVDKYINAKQKYLFNEKMLTLSAVNAIKLIYTSIDIELYLKSQDHVNNSLILVSTNNFITIIREIISKGFLFITNSLKQADSIYYVPKVVSTNFLDYLYASTLDKEKLDVVYLSLNNKIQALSRKNSIEFHRNVDNIVRDHLSKLIFNDDALKNQDIRLSIARILSLNNVSGILSLRKTTDYLSLNKYRLLDTPQEAELVESNKYYLLPKKLRWEKRKSKVISIFRSKPFQILNYLPLLLLIPIILTTDMKLKSTLLYFLPSLILIKSYSIFRSRFYLYSLMGVAIMCSSYFLIENLGLLQFALAIHLVWKQSKGLSYWKMISGAVVIMLGLLINLTSLEFLPKFYILGFGLLAIGSTILSFSAPLIELSRRNRFRRILPTLLFIAISVISTTTIKVLLTEYEILSILLLSAFIIVIPFFISLIVPR